MHEFYETLCEELKTDPLQLGYALMSDAEVAEVLNKRMRTRPVMRFCNLRTVAAVLDDVEYTTVKAVLATAAQYSERVKDMLHFLSLPCDEQGSTGGLDFGHPATRAFIQSLPISESVKQKLLALGEQRCSRAEELGLGTVTEGHVQSARKMLQEEK